MPRAPNPLALQNNFGPYGNLSLADYRAIRSQGKRSATGGFRCHYVSAENEAERPSLGSFHLGSVDANGTVVTEGGYRSDTYGGGPVAPRPRRTRP
jgi:hypothetical protein